MWELLLYLKLDGAIEFKEVCWVPTACTMLQHDSKGVVTDTSSLRASAVRALMWSSSRLQPAGMCKQICQVRSKSRSPTQVSRWRDGGVCLFAGKLSKATDVYAYGVILWEMLTGRRPWAGMLQMQVGRCCLDCAIAWAGLSILAVCGLGALLVAM